jgi:hypothetical protein
MGNEADAKEYFISNKRGHFFVVKNSKFCPDKLLECTFYPNIGALYDFAAENSGMPRDEVEGLENKVSEDQFFVISAVLPLEDMDSSIEDYVMSFEV